MPGLRLLVNLPVRTRFNNSGFGCSSVKNLSGIFTGWYQPGCNGREKDKDKNQDISVRKLLHIIMAYSSVKIERNEYREFI